MKHTFRKSYFSVTLTIKKFILIKLNESIDFIVNTIEGTNRNFFCGFHHEKGVLSNETVNDTHDQFENNGMAK